MWDLSSLTRDQTRSPCIARWILNHWNTREVLIDLNETITVLSRKNGRKIQLVIVTKHATQYYVMFIGYILMEQKCKHIHSYDKYQVGIVVIPLFEIVVTKGALIVCELCWVCVTLVFF